MPKKANFAPARSVLTKMIGTTVGMEGAGGIGESMMREDAGLSRLS